MSDQPDFELFSSLRYDPILTNLPTNTSSWGSTTTAPNPNHSPYYMLPFHRDRMLQAAEHFNWATAANRIQGASGFSHLLEKLNQAIDTNSTTPLRVRTLLSYDGIIRIETMPVPALPAETLYPFRLPPPRAASKQTVEASPLTGGSLTLGPDDIVQGDPPRENPFLVLPDTGNTTASPFTSYKTTSRDMYTKARERVGIMDWGERKEVLLVSGEGEIMEGSLTSPYFWRDGRWVTPTVGSGGQVGTTRRWALEKGFCVEGVVKVDSLVDGEECWISNGVRGFLWGQVKLS
ncbi:Uncharacterized protein BP5553_05001 [Venustampulla echinocandica]|uniref:Aminodeoxychorismate lyase n=1 Tax=Venustampulla echinocandica TaxID=2656787 RepID=A0A370TPX7_9HELO|nr:Uncharacterized protein BP5553_05001 [Venustampulla echinocandica]RDL37568.1 Uncharacterized protein BP5553_05001 [Venustampulla echinocandica]